MRTSAKDGGLTESVWIDAQVPRFDSEPEPETDVCIVGAGIAGLTTAFELVRRGTRVMVLDDGPVGGGETGRTSAHLASAVDDHFHVLEGRFGEDGARQVAESHAAAIDYIEAVAGELAIDCDFRRVDGYLFAPPGTRADRMLDKELAAAQRAGLIVDRVASAPLPFETGPALRFGRQAEFHPLRYLRGLATAIADGGGHIHTGVRVTAIEHGDQPLRVRLADGRVVACRIAVDATNGAMTSPLRLAIRQAAYRTYVIAFDVPHGTLPHALFWDTGDPYHYIRLAAGEDGRELLLVGGNDHRTGQGDPDKALRELEAWTRRWLPIAGPVVRRWSGQVIEPIDSLAHIGRSPEHEHVYLVSGDSGNGLTHGTIAGLLLPELMRGHRPPWAAIYDPKRSHLHAAGTWIAEAAHSSLPYTDWLRGGDVGSLDAIDPGEGAVLRRGLKLIAAYRDPAGHCHLRSATCTHLRGVVSWNPVEKTWDCPCHGSRFDPYGRVLNGPAAQDLSSLERPPGDSQPTPRAPRRDERRSPPLRPAHRTTSRRR